MADLGISAFLNNFQFGGARANRFIVQFNWPSALQSLPNISAIQNNPELFRVSCKAATVPTSNNGVAEVKYMGRTIKLPGDKQFDDWSLTILNDTTYPIRKAFEEWNNAIMGHISNVEAAGLTVSQFFGSAYVYQLGRKDDVATAVYLIDKIFPLQVGEIALSYENENVVEEFPVNFSVNEWTSLSTDHKF